MQNSWKPYVNSKTQFYCWEKGKMLQKLNWENTNGTKTGSVTQLRGRTRHGTEGDADINTQKDNEGVRTHDENS